MTLILDYEAGNLASVRRACAHVGLQAQYCADPDQLLPTVGCARWRAGQLEAELARGSWALVSADAGTISSMLLGRAAGPTADRDPLEPLDGLDSTDAETTLANYEKTWRATGNVRPTIEAAFRWLEKRLPAEKVTPRMVHGDFRNGNIMVDPNDGLVAVLDWEIVHVGDPAEDLGWLCTSSWKFGRPDRYVGGFGELDDLLAGYAEAGGEPMSAARVDFWSMLGSLKWGVMTMGMYASFAADPSAGPERAVIGRRLSETEADIVAIIERNA